MSNDEIVAALRYCQITEHSDCWGCPANIGSAGCLDALHKKAADVLEDQQKRIDGLESECRWIPVTERLPEEHDSMFASWYGTSKWLPGMFKTISNSVIAVVVLVNGRRIVRERHTSEGQWNLGGILGAKEVTHWMPLPEPPKGE